MIRRITLLACLFAIPATAFSLSPPPPRPDQRIDQFVAFYEATGGDEWVNNEGWLEPDTDPCDWYGVTCGHNHEWGFLQVDRLELPNNNLRGNLAQSRAAWWVVHVADTLDLSGNCLNYDIVGDETRPLHFPVSEFGRIRKVDWSDNCFTGPLPTLSWSEELASDLPYELQDLRELNLSGNAFSGSIPEDWAFLQLNQLQLADNQLSGEIYPALVAITPDDEQAGHLDLAGNHFDVLLDESTTEALLALRNEHPLGGGLRLCWNELEFSSDEVRQWVDERHVGGPTAACINRERSDITAAVAGSWYAPERDGKGATFHWLNESTLVYYHFGFDSAGNQEWLYGLGQANDQAIQLDSAWAFAGTFGHGRLADTEPREKARIRLDRIDTDVLMFDRVYTPTTCPVPDGNNFGPTPCHLPALSDRLSFARLTEAAGTTCDNVSDNQWIAGAWYDPASDGEGLIIEVAQTGLVTAYWFTYLPESGDQAGAQAWMIGSGELDSTGRLQIDSMFKPEGGWLGYGLEVDLAPWGALELQFNSDQPDTAHAQYSSHDDEFGSGGIDLIRLTQPWTASCD